MQTMTADPLSGILEPREIRPLIGLSVLWSREEPRRVGEVLLLPNESAGRPWIFGRGDAPTEHGPHRVKLFRQRPGIIEPVAALQSPRISRAQLQLQVQPSGALQVDNIGRCVMIVNGVETSTAELNPGDVLEIQHELLLLCLRRPNVLPAHPELAQAGLHPFGEADALGFVGESPEVWELRRQLLFVAPRQAHVLILGASGTGKELAARAIHMLSSRRAKPLVSRNAATFPETLIDAELFGNAKNFPNPGMPDRPGLIGDADGSTLFLDEIGELPVSLQSHLLRVLDQGEYQRLGESTTRRSDLRLVGATNRPESHLKHDVLARLGSRVQLPDLNSRREDIPLIARYLLRRIAAADQGLADRYFVGGSSGEPRMTPNFLRLLVQHHYTTNVRELEALLWKSMSESPVNYLDLVEGMQLEPATATKRTAPAKRREPDSRPTLDRTAESGEVRMAVDPTTITREMLQEALDRHQGVQDRVWRDLGLPSRFVLYRLIKKYGLVVKRSSGEVETEGQ